MDEINITLIAVGIDPWPVSCAGLVDSVRQHEPGAGLMIVDNCAEPAYPSTIWIERTSRRLSMAEAMNFGAKFAPSADWLLFGNNDIVCTAPYLAMVRGLSPDTVYGVDMLDWWGRRWLDGWIMAIPRPIWEAVGEFDPAFVYAGFEDADYCFRALERGYKVEAAALPFVHRELHSRFTMPGYMQQRERNIEHLCEKWGIVR